MRTRLRSSSSGGQVLGTTVVLLLLSALLCAQFKTNVLLISMVATVVDGKGRTVPNLTSDDFILEEDGQPQTITHLLPSADLPISIGVMLDVSYSMASKILTARRAIDSFLLKTHADDEIFLMTFDTQAKVIAGFTSDRNRLRAALWAGGNVGGGTSLYDSLYQGLQKVKEGRHQKKAVLLVTDGEDTTSMTRPGKALRNIREADMLVYSIGIKGTPGFDMGTNRPSGNSGSRATTVDMKVLKEFGDVSGGWAEEISESTFGEKLDVVLRRIADELRSQYSIGFYPNRPREDGRWHNVQIRMKNPDYRSRGRKEYFDPALRYAGRSLADVLHDLESLGLKVLWSSELVRAEMRVASEPTSTDPRTILDDVLEPHGLRAVAGPKGTLSVLRAR